MVHNSRRHSSRLLITAKVLCSSSGVSKNGNIAAPISEYSTTMTHRPGVENKMRNVKCIHRFVWIAVTSSLSSTISPSLFSTCDILTHTRAKSTFANADNSNTLSIRCSKFFLSLHISLMIVHRINWLTAQSRLWRENSD